MKKLPALLLALLVSAASASAQTTYTYEYDQYGRLVRVERNTGASTRVRYGYDGVDNRTRVKQGVSAPVAVDDDGWVEGSSATFQISDLMFNDTDADLPFDSFSITAIGGPDVSHASIGSGGQTLSVWGTEGSSYTVTYTVTDGSGLSSTATIYGYFMPPITCPPECW